MIDTGPAQNAVARDYAEPWRATAKIIYSRTLQAVSSARARITPGPSPS